jgi:phosphoadenosine phosphosulfate reductase
MTALASSARRMTAFGRLFARNSPVNAVDSELGALNAALTRLGAEERVRRALAVLPGQYVLASSFGAQAAVMLHLVTRQVPQIPVVLIDTGYLFSETYRFVDELSERLRLNLKVYRSDSSPAWQESRWGRLWEQGADGIDRYNRVNKVEPMRQALAELRCGTWFSGLRRAQARTRAHAQAVQIQDGRYKVYPLFDWSDREVGTYLRQHRLPYHPLWEKGFVSIGDWHTTRSLAEVSTPEETRFFGLRRECGLHASG